MQEERELTNKPERLLAPGPGALSEEARLVLSEAIKELKAKDGPMLDEAIKHIRYAIGLLEMVEL